MANRVAWLTLVLSMLVFIGMTNGVSAADLPGDTTSGVPSSPETEANIANHGAQPSLSPFAGLKVGIDFSCWWSTYWNQEDVLGPGFNVAFPLVRNHLDVLFKAGMMIGDKNHMMPFELYLKVPFKITDNFSPYIKAGPMLARKTFDDYRLFSFFVAGGAGMELSAPGYNWNFYLAFDYGFQVSSNPQEENQHVQLLGFSTGVNYIF